MTNSGPMLILPPPGGQKKKKPNRRPPLPEEKLFLGGVVDAIGDAAGWVGDQAKSAYNSTAGQAISTVAGTAALGPIGGVLANNSARDWVSENPAKVGKIGGAALAAGLAPVTGGASLSLMGPAMKLGSEVGGSLGTTERERKRQEMMRRRASMGALRSPLPSLGGSGGASTGSGQTKIVAKGGYIEDQMRNGGTVNIGQDAEEFVGPKHENGGVQLNPNTEVEGGETMDKVNNSEYVFSDRLTVPKEILPDESRGMTFAEYHKQLVNNNASQSQIQELAEIQERVAGRKEGDSGRSIGGNRGQNEPNQRMKHLGPMGKRFRQMGQQQRQNSGLNIMDNKKAMGGKTYTDDDRQRYDYASGGEVKYQDGGFFGNGLSFGIDSYSQLPESSGDVDGFGSVLGTGNMDFGIGSYSKLPQGPIESQGGQGFLSQAGDIAEGALPYLPAIMNVGRGLFDDADVPDVPYTPPSGRSERTIRQMDTDVNVDDQLASVDRTLRSIIADPTASQNQKRAAAANAAQQRAQIEGQEERKETGLQNEMLSRLASAQQRRDMAISQGRTQADRMERKQQMAADEQQFNLIQSGIQQASQRYQQQQRWKDKLDMDAMSLASQLATVPDEDVRNYVLSMLRDKFPEKASRVQNMINNQ